MRLVLLCTAAAAVVAGLELQRSSGTSRLLSLRGGLEPQLAGTAGARTRAAASTKTATASSTTKISARTAAKVVPRRSKKRGSSMRKLHDMVTALAVLTAIGAGQLTAAPIVESLPKLAQNPTWMVFGGSFISGLYLLVTLVHRQRARDLANLMFGEVRSSYAAPLSSQARDPDRCARSPFRATRPHGSSTCSPRRTSRWARWARCSPRPTAAARAESKR